MTIVFDLPMKPFSVNAYHYRDKRHKTAEARQWEREVDLLLGGEPLLAQLIDEVAKHVEIGQFHVTLTATYPWSVFYNKQGAVSAKTMDLSNWEKPLIDRLFVERLKIDDRFITSLHSLKKPGEAHSIRIQLTHLLPPPLPQEM